MKVRATQLKLDFWKVLFRIAEGHDSFEHHWWRFLSLGCFFSAGSNLQGQPSNSRFLKGTVMWTHPNTIGQRFLGSDSGWAGASVWWKIELPLYGWGNISTVHGLREWRAECNPSSARYELLDLRTSPRERSQPFMDMKQIIHGDTASSISLDFRGKELELYNWFNHV